MVCYFTVDMQKRDSLSSTEKFCKYMLMFIQKLNHHKVKKTTTQNPSLAELTNQQKCHVNP